MRLHIVLCDHVQTVDIAQTVDHGIVGIMAGPDRVDVIALHDHDVFDLVLSAGRSSRLAGELMAVCPVEDDALSVQLHESVLHLKMTEADQL